MSLFVATPKRRRSIIVISVSLLLLTGFGVAYFLYRRNSKTEQRLGIAQGNVIQVVGNTIVLREVGKDVANPADDVPKTYMITDSTQVKVPGSDGTFVAANSEALRTVGSLVVIRSSKMNDKGFEEIQSADILYLPSKAEQQ